MRTPRRGFAVPLVLAIIAVLLVGGGIYEYTKDKMVIQTPDWNAYSGNNYVNTQYGFSVRYPNDMPPTPIPDRWSKNISMISFGTDTDGVIVSVITNPADVANCLVTPRNVLPSTYTVSDSKIVRIREVPFLSYFVSNTTAKKPINTHYYTSVQNGVCFSIRQTTSSATYDDLQSKMSGIVWSFWTASSSLSTEIDPL